MYHVKVTTSLLAEAATVCEGKLYVHAGGWDVLNTPIMPVTFPQIALVLVIETAAEEVTGEDLEVRLVDSDDAAVMGVTGRLVIPDLSERSPDTIIRIPLVVPFHGVTFSHAGAYLFKVSLAGSLIESASLAVQMLP